MDNITYCIANWKMNKNKYECKEFMQSFEQNMSKSKLVQPIICPPFTLLDSIKTFFQDDSIEIGSQNLSFEEKGSITGEVSASMLKDIGCKWSIIGHSERRVLFNENNEILLKKLIQCISNDINPIFCIGENQKERNAGNTFNILSEQLVPIFSSINVPEELNLLIAYEPIWAIGSGMTASVEIIYETHSLIDDIFNKINSNINYSIVYGGSVNSKNVKNLLTIKNLDGFLIGGASLQAKEFNSIHQQCKERIK